MVKVGGKEVTGEEAERVKAGAQRAAAAARQAAQQAREGAQRSAQRETTSAGAPDTITSKDVVGRGIIQNGVRYQWTGETDPATGQFIYRKST